MVSRCRLISASPIPHEVDISVVQIRSHFNVCANTRDPCMAAWRYVTRRCAASTHSRFLARYVGLEGPILSFPFCAFTPPLHNKSALSLRLNSSAHLTQNVSQSTSKEARPRQSHTNQSSSQETRPATSKNDSTQNRRSCASQRNHNKSARKSTSSESQSASRKSTSSQSTRPPCRSQARTSQSRQLDQPHSARRRRQRGQLCRLIGGRRRK